MMCPSLTRRLGWIVQSGAWHDMFVHKYSGNFDEASGPCPVQRVLSGDHAGPVLFPVGCFGRTGKWR
jgi:hypothetical protein